MTTTTEITIDLGFIGNKAERFKELYKNYSPEPNEHGYFLKFENYTQLVVNQGVLVYTNCFETEEEFMNDLTNKMLFEI